MQQTAIFTPGDYPMESPKRRRSTSANAELQLEPTSTGWTIKSSFSLAVLVLVIIRLLTWAPSLLAQTAPEFVKQLRNVKEAVAGPPDCVTYNHVDFCQDSCHSENGFWLGDDWAKSEEMVNAWKELYGKHMPISFIRNSVQFCPSDGQFWEAHTFYTFKKQMAWMVKAKSDLDKFDYDNHMWLRREEFEDASPQPTATGHFRWPTKGKGSIRWRDKM